VLVVGDADRVLSPAARGPEDARREVLGVVGEQLRPGEEGPWGAGVGIVEDLDLDVADDAVAAADQELERVAQVEHAFGGDGVGLDDEVVVAIPFSQDDGVEEADALGQLGLIEAHEVPGLGRTGVELDRLDGRAVPGLEVVRLWLDELAEDVVQDYERSVVPARAEHGKVHLDKKLGRGCVCVVVLW